MFITQNARSLMTRSIILAIGFLLAACAGVDKPAGPAVELSPGAAWVSAETGWAEEAREVYAEATAYVLAQAKTRPQQSWAVVLDLDETVINNVQYQIQRETLGEGYSPESWSDWTQEKRATLVPGVEDFLAAVNSAGGHVAFVTNRSDEEQLATEENLDALGVRRHEDFRVLLTRARPAGTSNKDARYALVPAMLAVQGYADVAVIAYVGDNKGDKPEAPGEWRFFCIDQGAMYGDACAATPGPGR